MPVYQKGANLADSKGREAAHIGWVYGAFRAGDLMEGILTDRNNPLDN